MKKILQFLLLSALLPLAANDLSDLRGLSLVNAKIPIYNRGGKPQMMIFVNRAERQGRLIAGNGTVLEFIRPSANVDTIGDAWKIKPYKLEASFAEVLDFWAPRLTYSEAVVVTSRADIDQVTHKASGSAPLFLRSPLLDLNGVGFEADFDRREIRINSEVEILVRTGNNDPRKAGSKAMGKYSFIRAKGDALLIELEEKRIMLIGSVEVKEEHATISCDRLTVIMDGKDRQSKENKDKERIIDAESELQGISQLLADGSITISGSGKDSGRLYADHMVYDIKKGIVTLTSDGGSRMLSRQDLRKNIQRISSRDPRNIDGYVVIDDPRMRVYGKLVQVLLNDKEKSDLPAAGFLNAGVSGGLAGTNRNMLKSILCPEGITIAGKAQGKEQSSFLLDADSGRFLPQNNSIKLTGGVKARNGEISLDCRRAEINLTEQQSGKSGAGSIRNILCRENVVLRSQSADGKSGRLTSDKADFLAASDKIIFYENVRSTHNQSTLSCDNLELLLGQKRSRTSDPGIAVGKNTLDQAAASGKTLQQAIASGNVVMTDPNASIKTGLLTLFFRELAPGEKPAPGMLQSGGVRLVRAECRDGINAWSNAAQEQTQKAGRNNTASSRGLKRLTARQMDADFVKNISVFRDDVKVHDDLSVLKCQEMHLFGKETAPAAAVSKKPVPAAAADDLPPDDDPFSMPATEDTAPSRILITGNLELEKVECRKNVLLTRKIGKERFKAGSELAVYDVASRKIRMTAQPPAQPWMQMGKRRQLSDMFIFHLDEERFESKGQTTFINK